MCVCVCVWGGGGGGGGGSGTIKLLACANSVSRRSSSPPRAGTPGYEASAQPADHSDDSPMVTVKNQFVHQYYIMMEKAGL